MLAGQGLTHLQSPLGIPRAASCIMRIECSRHAKSFFLVNRGWARGEGEEGPDGVSPECALRWGVRGAFHAWTSGVSLPITDCGFVCVCVCVCVLLCAGVLAVARAPGDRPLPQGKMGTANTAQDLSEKLEEYQSGQFKMPDEIKRALQMIRMLDDKVDEARAQIRKESEEYVCAKDHKSAASLELKAKIDSRQSNCLSWAEQKESQAAMCVDLVNREMMKLDEYIANIDESIFTNMEEEDAGTARGAAGGMGSRSGGGGISGGGQDRKRKSGGGDRNAWIQEGAMCEVWGGTKIAGPCLRACNFVRTRARICAYMLLLQVCMLAHV